MPRRKTAQRNADSRNSESGPPSLKTKLFAKQNRGLLLDILVFGANVLVMRLLSGLVIGLFGQVSAEQPAAKLLLGLMFLAMWILPALGAVLKRWHFHRRLKAEGRIFEADSNLAGCLFNPIFYFCLNLVITSAVLTGLGDALFGNPAEQWTALYLADNRRPHTDNLPDVFDLSILFSAEETAPQRVSERSEK